MAGAGEDSAGNDSAGNDGAGNDGAGESAAAHSPVAVDRGRPTVLVLVGVALAVVGSFAVAVIAAPGRSEGPEAVRDRGVAACVRAGAAEDACRCALDRLAAGGVVLTDLDEDLSTPLSLPADLAASIEDCGSADDVG